MTDTPKVPGANMVIDCAMTAPQFADLFVKMFSILEFHDDEFTRAVRSHIKAKAADSAGAFAALESFEGDKNVPN